MHERWNPAGGKPKFVLESITTREVSKMISDLKSSSAFGDDKHDASIVKMAASVLIPVITHVINLSLGTKTSSYCPVSLLPLVSKLAERSVQVQILKYLELTDQLSPNHHAYRSSTSTSTMLIQLMDTIATATDMNLISATMLMDLSVSINCVKHKTLHKKLMYYGFDADTLDWIKSYLTLRSSYVVIGSVRSSFKTLTHLRDRS